MAGIWVIVLLVIIIYVYVGYPFFIRAAGFFSRKQIAPEISEDKLPEVSFIIAARNEAKTISDKLKNVLSLGYPKTRLQVIVVSDGSSDTTNEIIKGFQNDGVKLIVSEEHIGKSAAQNMAVESATGEILVFSDATGIYSRDALKYLTRWFSMSGVGCVIGRVAYSSEGLTGEDIYWNYELAIRNSESCAGIFAMGTGSIMALRKDIFTRLEPDIGEDFVLPLRAVSMNYKVLYEPLAVSVEEPPTQLFRTKARIITKDFRGLMKYKNLLNPFVHQGYAVGLISHKLLRWLIPFFLITLFITNALALQLNVSFCILFCAQVLAYSAGIVTFCVPRLRKYSLLRASAGFLEVNTAALCGVLGYFFGRRTGKWEPIRA